MASVVKTARFNTEEEAELYRFVERHGLKRALIILYNHYNEDKNKLDHILNKLDNLKVTTVKSENVKEEYNYNEAVEKEEASNEIKNSLKNMKFF